MKESSHPFPALGAQNESEDGLRRTLNRAFGGKKPIPDLSELFNKLRGLLRRIAPHIRFWGKHSSARFAQTYLSEKNARVQADVEKALAWLQHARTMAR